jgi:hypothetical protein
MSTRKPLASKARMLAHLVLLLGGWLLFFAGWWRVIESQRINLAVLGWLILGALLLIPLITLLWQHHNLHLYKRKGPRLNLRRVEERYERDWQGLQVSADWIGLRAANSIDIALEPTQKRYQRRA